MEPDPKEGAAGVASQGTSPMPSIPAPRSKSRVWIFGIGSAALMAAVLAAGYFFVLPKISGPATEKVYHVGVLNALDYFSPVVDGFKEEMTKLGYVEGKNIIYDVQKGQAPVGNQAIVKKFVDDKVDLILAFPTEASLEAKELTKGTSIPIVSVAFGLEGSGLVDSVQSPGGNVTGVRFPIPEVAAKRFEILHELVPEAHRILVPYLKDYPTVAAALPMLRPAAQALDITLLEVALSSPEEMISYLAAHEKNGEIDAILTIPEPISTLPPFMDPMYAYAKAHKIPVAGIAITETEEGAVFSLIPSAPDMGKLAAPLADKIFKGVSAGTIPIVTPESRLEINYKAAQRLGITVSENLLGVADRVVH